MEEKFRQLAELGAGEFEHINGSLIDHLQGTRNLLKSWLASEVLQDAGLYHAAYGTAGFSEGLVSTRNRQEIAKIIGHEAEAMVYLYCSCDRDNVWPQIGGSSNVEFRDRFTGQTYLLSDHELSNFCELTVANELEIATDNPEFKNTHGQSLFKLFRKMQPYLSHQANLAIGEVLGEKGGRS
jgi:Domain of unknown function (DUF6817)